MMSGLARLAQPLLFALPPEEAHSATIKALASGLYPRADAPDDPRLACDVLGLRFSNPLGVSAGFDKNGEVPGALLAMGCGFAEVGTITPRPQPGNPKPRVFRLIRDRAVINRQGFPSQGHAAVLARLQRRRPAGIVGINIGANRDSTDRVSDYVSGIEAFADIASYFMANISSPNTPGLRTLQAPQALEELLAGMMAARTRLAAAGRPAPPVLIKIAPDIDEADVETMVEQMLRHGVDGLAVANTTVSRAGLQDVETGRQAGGLSGRPLFHRSTVMLARIYRMVGTRIVLIGSGGIESGETALAKIEAGASLLQLYTALIYEGAGLVGRIKRHLAVALDEAKANSLAELRGRRAEEWASRTDQT